MSKGWPFPQPPSHVLKRTPLIQAKINLLKRARQVLENWTANRCSGVCSALDTAADTLGGSRTEQARDELACYVMRSLQLPAHSVAYLASWQEYHRVRSPLDTDLEQLKKDRLAWIDWMIQCYEEDFPL